MNADAAALRAPRALTSNTTPRENEVMQFATAESPLGLVLVAWSGTGLCAVLLGADRTALQRDLQRRFPGATLVEGTETSGSIARDVVALVEFPGRPADIPLDMRGTEFERRVWRALREIPPGSTASYSDIATRIGAPHAAQDVAAACAANHLAVVVPCHRVIRKDGSLSGYRWGIERKRALLAREAAI